MIRTQQVNLFYPGNRQALHQIDFTLAEHECVLICGESGSGKSSLINLINGIATRYENCHYTGEVYLQGVDANSYELYEISREISNVFQNPKTHFFNVDTTTELLFYLENRGFPKEEMHRRLADLLEVFPIEHLLDRSIFDLSGGEKQILSIAASYIAGTKILILDEPSSNLDHDYTEILAAMLKKIKEQGVTILIAEHRLYYLQEVVDRILFMKDGEITACYSKKDFFSFSEKKREELGLRSLHKVEVDDQKGREGKKDFVLRHLTYDFPKALKGIEVKDLSFSTGSIVGIVGENGSGKSSFITSLMGLASKATVAVELDGKKLNKKQLVNMSGFVMQDVNHQLFTDTVLTEVTLNLKNVDEKRVEEVLKRLDLWKYRDQHPMSLSGGQKQRVAIASVLLSDAKIICFDEPTSGMDRKNMYRVSELIRSCSTEDNLIFIISHDYEFLNTLTDTVLNMEHHTRKRSTMFKKIMDYGQEEKWHFDLSLVYMVLSTAAWISAFIAAYGLINGFLQNHVNQPFWIKHAIWIVLSMLIYGIFKGEGLKHSHIFAYATLGKIRKSFADKMVRNPLGFTLKQTAGDYRQKIVDNVEQLEILLAHLLTEGIPHSLAIVSILIMIFVVDFRLGILSLIPVLISMFLMGRMLRAGMKEMVRYHEAAKDMSGNIVEYIEGIEVIKIFNQKERSYEKLTQSVHNFRDFTLGWYRRSWNTMAIVAAVAPTMTLFVFPVGILMMRADRLALSQLILISLLSFSLATSIPKIQFFFSAGAQIGKKLEDLERDFESPELLTGNELLDPSRLDIRYDRVSFAYEDQVVLRDCSFTIQQGEKVAFVGESGSGKSTLVKLLMHYYDVQKGEILIGGKPLTTLDPENHMDHISYVSQDNFLFDTTIRENILIGKQDATEEELIRACQAAQIHEFIMSLEKGYDTLVGESGSKLSGGERQRICIARAMIKDAPIVVMDEATSFTDPENEYYIDRGIAELCKGKTVITIAHKLSRIVGSDKIILVDKGEIKAVGTHEALLKEPVYLKLWNRLSASKDFQFDVKEERHA